VTAAEERDDAAPALRVASYNVRYAALDTGPRDWTNRRDAVAATIRLHQPDVLCLQEVWQDQLPDLRERLPGYEWVAERHGTGEHTPIGYRPERIEPVEGTTATFALAPDPTALGTTAWDAAVPRVATEATLRDRRTDEPFALVNAHFDHEGEVARRESAALVRERLCRADAGRRLLVGDLNCRPASGPYRRLVSHDGGTGPFVDARRVAAVRHGPGETFVGFGDEAVEAGTSYDPEAGKRIDYVLSEGFAVPLYATAAGVDVTWRHPSDHLPVVVDLVAATE
jgi:endonuclease/exonuclease/phosphatase family metal-dependent hydrolase